MQCNWQTETTKKARSSAKLRLCDNHSVRRVSKFFVSKKPQSRDARRLITNCGLARQNVAAWCFRCIRGEVRRAGCGRLASLRSRGGRIWAADYLAAQSCSGIAIKGRSAQSCLAPGGTKAVPSATYTAPLGPTATRRSVTADCELRLCS